MEALTTWKVTESTSMLKLKGAHGPDEETAHESANCRHTLRKFLDLTGLLFLRVGFWSASIKAKTRLWYLCYS